MNKVLADADLKKRLAATGSYTRPAMTADEVQAFVDKQQQTWQPILEKISKK
jgi:tripartite-type tricarboxylate transporter receptor subunit TctC